MDEQLKNFLMDEFAKIHEQFKRIDERFDGVEIRLERVETEVGQIKERLDDIEDVVRQSAHDILENQVEMVEKDNLHEAKITLLENNQLKLTATVIEQGKRIAKLEQVSEK